MTNDIVAIVILQGPLGREGENGIPGVDGLAVSLPSRLGITQKEYMRSCKIYKNTFVT